MDVNVMVWFAVAPLAVLAMILIVGTGLLVIAHPQVRAAAAVALFALVCVMGGASAFVYYVRNQSAQLDAAQRMALMAEKQENFLRSSEMLDVPKLERSMNREDVSERADVQPKAEVASETDLEYLSQPGQDRQSSKSGSTDDTPAWVSATPVKDRDGPVHRQSFSVGPFASLGDCQTEIPGAMAKAVDEYNSWYIEQRYGVASRRLWRPPQVHVDLSDPAQSHISSSELYDYGTMYEQHVLLEFDDAYRRRLDKAWEDTHVMYRLTRVGLGCCGIFGLLVTCYAYFNRSLGRFVVSNRS